MTGSAREAPEHRALMWVFDRLTSDDLTAQEIRTTAEEIGNVLLGRPSPASKYIPDEWSDSTALAAKELIMVNVNELQKAYDNLAAGPLELAAMYGPDVGPNDGIEATGHILAAMLSAARQQEAQDDD